MISFPFDELERYLLRAGANPDTRYAHGAPRILTNCEIARQTGRDPTAVARLRRRGTVPIISAERIAAHLDVCPSDIWPDYWDEMINREIRRQQYNDDYRRRTRANAA